MFRYNVLITSPLSGCEFYAFGQYVTLEMALVQQQTFEYRAGWAARIIRWRVG